MEDWIRPVDVISVCSTKGELRPLRLRLEENEENIRIDIQDVVSVKEIPYTGAEARIFLCRASVYGRECMIELKYTVRTLCWTLLGKVYG